MGGIVDVCEYKYRGKQEINKQTRSIMSTSQTDKQVAAKIFMCRIKSMYSKDKQLSHKLYEMNKFELEDFLIGYSEKEVKALKKLRRTEQIRVNVGIWREQMKTEINNLEETKQNYLKEKENLEKEIAEFQKLLED